MQGAYTAAVGTKFNEDGSVRPFPGNSIVSHVAPTAPQRALLVTLQEELASAAFGQSFAMLPATSLHMTVFDLVCDEVRVAEHWSPHIPLDSPLDEVDRRLTDLQLLVGKPGSLSMNFHYFSLEKTIGTVLVPADDATATALSSYREALSAATGIRHPDHDSYFFHISVAYLLQELDSGDMDALDRWVMTVDERLGDDFGCLELAAPELVLFPDMHHFPKRRQQR